MKKFKKFLDKKKKISSVSEEERFMYEVCTVSGIENIMASMYAPQADPVKVGHYACII